VSELSLFAVAEERARCRKCFALVDEAGELKA
jgi:hypothetical protein